MAENKLKKYNEKRDFSKTGEPRGRTARKKSKNLKFCVQRHAARSDHFDLRLELGGVALSWAVPKGPSFCTADKRLAMRVEDHPLDYMSFEGTIPKGEYGGGTVMLWDEGEWLPKLDPKKGLRDGSLKFTLDGARLKGDWALVRMKSEEDSEPWLLIKERDEFAKKSAGISRYTRGVRSGKSMSEISRVGGENPFDKVEVMLAKPTDELPLGKDWIYELKYDGHRTVAFCAGGKAALYTRNGRDCTKTFSAAAIAVEKALDGRAAVLDGEMIVANESGISDFGALQAYARSKDKKGLSYVVFDLLALDGKDLRPLPLSERKKKLEALIKNAPSTLVYSTHTDKITKSGLEALKSRGIEGIIAKRASSKYSSNRNGDWQKLKFRGSREFVVGGYTLGDAGELKSLLVGYYEDGGLKFVGRVGTGLSDATRRELKKTLDEIGKKTPPFSAVPKDYEERAVWVQPKLAAEVDFAEITSSGLLRQASFKGLRYDKPPKEIDGEHTSASAKADKRLTSEKTEKRRSSAVNGKKSSAATVMGIEITHPTKVTFPEKGVTKLALAEYYAAVLTRMLPYVKDRLISLLCCPSGVDGEKFFRRHLEGDFKGIGRVPDEDGEEFFYIKNEKGLISLVQYNAVEFHVWASKKSSPHRPDVMVFDLDPDEGLSLACVRRGVRDLKRILDGLGLKSFLKTSGGKGYHVAVPFKSGVDGRKFRDFSKRVAELMESTYPDRYTSNMTKAARRGKIYIDWQRNTAGSTSAAPYTVRARSSAAVSMPISWNELGRVAPDSISMRAAVGRLSKPDPWADFFAVKSTQKLK